MAGHDMPKRLPASEGGKRFPLNMRTTEAVRDRLEKEAVQSGRSLAQQVEYCLEQYLNTKDELEILRKPIVQMIAMALRQAELNSGKPWHEDEVTAQAFRNSVISIVDLLFPFKPLSNIVARKGRVDKALDLVDAALLAQDAVQGLDNQETATVRAKLQTLIERLNEGWSEEKQAHVLKDEPGE